MKDRGSEGGRKKTGEKKREKKRGGWKKTNTVRRGKLRESNLRDFPIKVYF